MGANPDQRRRHQTRKILHHRLIPPTKGRPPNRIQKLDHPHTLPSVQKRRRQQSLRLPSRLLIRLGIETRILAHIIHPHDFPLLHRRSHNSLPLGHPQRPQLRCAVPMGRVNDQLPRILIFQKDRTRLRLDPRPAFL